MILRLISDAGLRRGEVVDLRVRNVSQRALRFRGRGDKDRTVPLTGEPAAALKPFCSDKGPDDPVVGVGEGVIYRVVKKYGRLVGKPEMKPQRPPSHLRHPPAGTGSEYQGCPGTAGAQQCEYNTGLHSRRGQPSGGGDKGSQSASTNHSIR